MASRGFDGKVALLLGGRTRAAEHLCSATARTLVTAERDESGAGRNKEAEREVRGSELAEASEKHTTFPRSLWGLEAGDTKS